MTSVAKPAAANEEPEDFWRHAPPADAHAVTHVPSAPPMLAPSDGVIVAQGETAASSAAATAKAMVEARYIIAQHKPRNWLTVLSMLMESCQRPGFAAKTEYALPRWDARQRKTVHITGPTIRFAEEALRCAGNVDIRADVMLDDAEKRIVFVSVLDLQSNTNYGRSVVIPKVIERAKLKDGQTAKGQRVNSEGKIVFIVDATEDELLMKQNAAVSRVIRSDGLRLIPFDIKETALMVAATTRQKENATDPSAVAKRLSFGFFKLGVDADQLEKYLGKRLNAVNAADLEILNKLHESLSDGEITWQELVTMKAEGRDELTHDANGSGSTDTASNGAAAGPGAAGLRERLSQRNGGAKADTPTPKADAQIPERQREPGED